MKNRTLILIWIFVFLAPWADFSFSETRDDTKKESGGKKPAAKKNMRIEDLFGIVGGKGQQMERERSSTATSIRGKQRMERERSSTASSIRGLNPIAEEYGQGRQDLSRYIGDVQAMEEREISGQELKEFLKEEGLGPRQ